MHLAPQVVVQYKPIINSFQDKSTFKNAQHFVVAKSPSDDLIFSEKKKFKVTKTGGHKKRGMKEVAGEEVKATEETPKQAAEEPKPEQQ